MIYIKLSYLLLGQYCFSQQDEGEAEKKDGSFSEAPTSAAEDPSANTTGKTFMMLKGFPQWTILNEMYNFFPVNRLNPCKVWMVWIAVQCQYWFLTIKTKRLYKQRSENGELWVNYLKIVYMVTIKNWKVQQPYLGVPSARRKPTAIFCSITNLCNSSSYQAVTDQWNYNYFIICIIIIIVKQSNVYIFMRSNFYIYSK